MTFLTFSFFLASIAAVSVPILLHLLMRGKPKKILFPALELIRKWQKSNRRRFAIKHFLLLFVRCAVLLLFGLALARPAFRSKNTESSAFFGRTGSAPTAAVLLFDTSVRMGYASEGQTRLDAAKAFAEQIVARLPSGSQAAVLDSRPAHDAFQVDLLAAAERVRRLEISPSGRPVADSVAAALRLLETSERTRRELFIFSDITAAGWPQSSEAIVHRAAVSAERARRSDQEPIQTFLIDLSVPEYQNTGVVSMEITDDGTGSDGSLRLDLELSHIGSPREGIIELFLLDTNAVPNDSSEAPKEISASAKKIAVEPFSFPDTAGFERRCVTMRLSASEIGFVQGFVRMTPGGSLAADDVRWFAFDRRPKARILLVAPEPAEEKTLFVREALAPEEFRKTGRTPFEVETLSQEKYLTLSETDLAAYQAIFFLDPAPLSESGWKKTADFVSAGGGAGFFLGRAATPPEGFENSDARALLGGRPISQIRSPDGDRPLVSANDEHSVLANFHTWLAAGKIPWNEIPVFRSWKMERLDSANEPILQFADGSEALYARRLGRGVSLVSTTPFSDASGSGTAWNLLPAGEHAWVFLMLVDGVAHALTTGGGEILNYAPDETVTLRPRIKIFPDSVILTLPDGQKVPLAADAAERTVRFSAADKIGPYRVESEPNEEGESVASGFCVNIRPSDLELIPVVSERLEKIQNELSFKTIERVEEIESGRSAGGGLEIFPLVVLLCALFLAAETVLANRFYD